MSLSYPAHLICKSTLFVRSLRTYPLIRYLREEICIVYTVYQYVVYVVYQYCTSYVRWNMRLDLLITGNKLIICFLWNYNSRFSREYFDSVTDQNALHSVAFRIEILKCAINWTRISQMVERQTRDLEVQVWVPVQVRIFPSKSEIGFLILVYFGEWLEWMISTQV